MDGLNTSTALATRAEHLLDDTLAARTRGPGVRIPKAAPALPRLPPTRGGDHTWTRDHT